MRRITFLLIVLALAGVACSDGASADGEWVLDALEINGVAAPLPDDPIDLQITAREFNGSAGCNNLGGTASFSSDGSLTIDEAFWTEMACMPASLMKFESTYTTALLQADTWAVTDYFDDGKRLTFRGPEVALYYLPAP